MFMRHLSLSLILTMKEKQKLRTLRTYDEVLRFIKREDPESAVTRFMIDKLVKNGEVFHTKTGVKTLVDLDEILLKLGLIYED